MYLSNISDWLDEVYTLTYMQCSMSEYKITVSYWPFSNQFHYFCTFAMEWLRKCKATVFVNGQWNLNPSLYSVYICSSVSCRLLSLGLLSSHTHLISAWQIWKRIPKNLTVCGNIAWGPFTLIENRTNSHQVKVLLSEYHVVMLYYYNFTALLINVALQLCKHVPLITKNRLLSDI